MYIKDAKGGYNRHGEQWSSGYFLILMHPDESYGCREPIRAIVRFVRLHQFGQFMMGRLTIDKHKISLSGAYGADGLTRDVPRAIYDRGVRLPDALREAWNKGDGWNDAGNEAPAMRAWALENLKALRGL